MASVKIILRSKPNKDGTHALAIQIIKDRRKSIIHLGQHIRKDDWDDVHHTVKKSHPNSARLNNFLLRKLSDANNRVLEVETQKDDASAYALKQNIKPSGSTSFFTQAQDYLVQLKEAGKYNQYTAEKPRVNHFREFLGRDIVFQDITEAMLIRFKDWLKATRQIKERSAINALVTIRSVFSRVIKDKIVDPKYYPFGKGKVVISFPDSKKQGLTKPEIEQLENVVLSDEALHHARNLWLLSFYFAGMRVSDIFRLRWSDIQDGRLHYTMGKNDKGGSLKIPAKAQNILDQYSQFRANNSDLIFPELRNNDLKDNFKTQRTIAFKTSAIDKRLRKDVAPAAGIDKKLTMHVARHSFAQNAKGIDIRILQGLFRHSNIETTEGYMGQFNHEEADAALENVLKP